MPIKYNETGMDLVNATPLLDRVIDVNPSASEDMMSEILSQKMKMKATSMLNMVGVLTPVTYYQAVADSSRVARRHLRLGRTVGEYVRHARQRPLPLPTVRSPLLPHAFYLQEP